MLSSAREPWRSIFARWGNGAAVLEEEGGIQNEGRCLGIDIRRTTGCSAGLGDVDTFTGAATSEKGLMVTMKSFEPYVNTDVGNGCSSRGGCDFSIQGL